MGVKILGINAHNVYTPSHVYHRTSAPLSMSLCGVGRCIVQRLGLRARGRGRMHREGVARAS